MLILFDFIINVFEAICIFLLIHLLTWRINKPEVLNSPFYKLKTIISLLIFISFSNTLQIVCDIISNMPINKYIGLIGLVLGVSLIFSITYNNIKKIHYYALTSLFSIFVLLIAEIMVVGVSSMFHINIGEVTGIYYIPMCILAILLKYMLLGIVICILEPAFFKQLIKRQKDFGTTLLASTVMMTARTTSRGASWFWFYNPKTPKGLNKNKNSK